MSGKKKVPIQDMPPPGGYAAYQFDRIPLRRFFRGRLATALFIAANVVGMPLYFKNWKEERIRSIENMSGELALLPILWAQQDRAKLRHMKKLRDLEADVMKDFPFWQVGTLLGDQLFESLSKDTYIEPMMVELALYQDPIEIPFVKTSFFIM